jgi:hypothetical protein
MFRRPKKDKSVEEKLAQMGYPPVPPKNGTHPMPLEDFGPIRSLVEGLEDLKEACGQINSHEVPPRVRIAIMRLLTAFEECRLEATERSPQSLTPSLYVSSHFPAACELA